MQDVLRRCNSIGNKSGIYHLAKVTFVKHETSIKTVSDLCAFVNDIRINCIPAIYLFEYLGFIRVTDNKINANKEAIELADKKISDFGTAISYVCLKRMLDEEMIDLQSIHFQCDKDQYYIKRSSFPLYAAVFRNLLIEFGAINEKSTGDFYLNNMYTTIFEKKVREVRKTLSLEQLKKQLEKQQKQGEVAEKFVVEYEIKRLNRVDNQLQVKSISEIDVGAGYDIISFENSDDEQYNRFIEVKSYRRIPHFYWTKNEKEVSTNLFDKYFIYLVDIDNVEDELYNPIIIQNPIKKLYEDSSWLIESESYSIQKID